MQNDVSQAAIKLRLCFETNLYLYMYPSNLAPVILPADTTHEEGTDRVLETSANKIIQRKEYNIPNMAKV
jgi:hypothetical protein